MKIIKENLPIVIILILNLYMSILALVFIDSAPPTRTEIAELVSQTNTTATFITEDGHLFSADVGELLELNTDYILVFDTKKTADRTDDIILSILKNIK